MALFTLRGNKNRKLRFIFQIYDMDNDGFISNGELFMVLKKMCGDNLTEEQLQEIVDRTILEGDLDKDGKLSFQEFSSLAEGTDVWNKMFININ